MSQSKKQSFIEVCCGTFTGMLGSWLITITVLKLVPDLWLASVLTVVLCTIWSLVRNYAIRRYFNRKN